MFRRFKMYMQLCTRHVDNTGHTFITIFLLQLFSCKLPWLVFLDSSQCQLLPYQQFHCSCSLWCLMSTARNVFSPHSIITLSRYIWSFKIFLYDSYKMIPQKSEEIHHFMLIYLLHSWPYCNWCLAALIPQILGQESNSIFVYCAFDVTPYLYTAWLKKWFLADWCFSILHFVH